MAGLLLEIMMVKGWSPMHDTEIKSAVVRIKVIGVGGGGNSVIERIAKENVLDIDLIAVNTDAKQLQHLPEVGVKTLQIGADLTKGLGTGAKFDLGEAAARADSDKIKTMLAGADMVFITAGMGGGTGTGATPVIAELAKDLGILTVGVVTVPFSFEGSRKKKVAASGLEKMREHMDALIDVHNDNLLKLETGHKLSLVEAFGAADGVLKQAIRCISELILTIGVINVDFADVKSIFQQSKSPEALLGIGESLDGAVKAVQMAVNSPLIEKSLVGARGIILNISGNENLTLYEVNEATKYIYEHTNPDVNIILGTVVNEKFADTVQATIIATDFVDGTAVKRKEDKVEERTDTGLEVPQFLGHFTAHSVDNAGLGHFRVPGSSKVPEFKPGKKE